jgi:hypothetical protein
MPLTSTPLLLDDYERNRKIAERLAAGGQQSARMGIDALATMEQLAKQGRAEARQKGLDEQAEGRLVLERKDKDAANVRAAAEAARAAEEHALRIPQLQRKGERDEEQYQEGRLVLQRSEAAKTREKLLADQVANAIEMGESPEDLAYRLRDEEATHDVGTSEVRNLYRKLTDERNAKRYGQDLQEREQKRKEQGTAQGWKQLQIAEEAAKTKATDKASAVDDKGADALRKEMGALPAIKEFAEVDVAFKRMKQAAASPSPAGDLTLVYSFMKMQDPSSTVRESEFASAAKAGTFGDQMQAQVERITTGELLTPQQRQDLLKQAESSYRARKNAADAAGGRYRGIAERRGLNVNDVVPSDVPDDDRW